MFRITTLILLLLFLQGCAYLNSLSSDLPQQIDEWAAAQEYGKALDTLSYVSKKHKQYALLKRQKRKIVLKAKEFELDQHLAAQSQEQKGQWHKADTIYSNALKKFPKSKLLNTEYPAFIVRRDKYLKDLEFKLSIAKGTWLIESTPLQKKIIHAAPEDYITQRRYEKNTRELQHTADELMTCTETAIQAGRFPLAETCLQTAEQLKAPYVDKEKLKRFRTQLKKSHKQLVKKQNAKTRALLSELKQGYSHENLQRAHRHLSEISEYKKQDKETKKLVKELDKYIKTGLAQRMEAGRRMYSNGQIQEALSIWIPLKSIAPENTKLNDHIERAKRVVNKLETLSNTPSPIAIPR